jgi:hypothetical protein
MRTLKFFSKIWKYLNTRALAGITLSTILLLGTLPVVAPATGCTSTQVIDEINVVLNEADAVLAVADPSSPQVGDLKKAIVALEGAEKIWQKGGTVAVVDDALNTLDQVLAAIPLTAIYSPLIDVLVAGIEDVLAALPQPVSAKFAATLAANPHAGRYQIQKRFYRTPAGNLKANWNQVAKAKGLRLMLLK